MTTKIERLSVISHNSFTYIVSSSPNHNCIEYYKDLLLYHEITTVIRLCYEIEYDDNYLIKYGITVIDLPIEDGSVPNSYMLEKWINTIKLEIKKNKKGIAVHCISGLGRSPLFTCIGLIIIEKIEPTDAISIVRKYIPTALNNKQLLYLYDLYIPTNKCVIM